jgi:hypothetical protein
MSWNGATGVAGWQVLSGQSATSLAPAGAVAREGFESSVVVPNAPWVQAQALDASGAVIGTSRPHNV